jgi:lipopolysaccharide/colanic/teichoic acid biosynthesis glycosyltransferase
MSVTTTDALESMRIQPERHLSSRVLRADRPSGNPISLDESQGKARIYPFVKAGIEWCAALAMFIIALPVIAVLAAAVKLTSKGPAVYSQTRLGKNGRNYRMFKLRSMVHNAENGTGAVWAARGDARITKIGKILRDTHLDELPQLWNVVKGEMALIGPRPERPELAAGITQRIPEFAGRLKVKPGVTGLAQMLLPADDPNDTELLGLRKKLGHDLYYISHQTFGMDLRIAIATPCYFFTAAIEAMRIKMLDPMGRAAIKKHEGLIQNESYEEVA